MLLFDHLTLAAFIHSLALSLLHTAYVPQTKKMRSTRQRVYGKSQSSDFIACLRSAKASLSCSMECGTVTRVAPSASVSTLPSPHSITTHTKQPTRCSTLNSPNRTSQTRLEDSCFRNCATHERTERPSRPGQTPSQRQSRSQSESLSHSSASSVSKCTKCTNGVKVCESRLVLKRSWIRVVVVCAVRCRCPLYALRSTLYAVSAAASPPW